MKNIIFTYHAPDYKESTSGIWSISVKWQTSDSIYHSIDTRKLSEPTIETFIQAINETIVAMEEVNERIAPSSKTSKTNMLIKYSAPAPRPHYNIYEKVWELSLIWTTTDNTKKGIGHIGRSEPTIEKVLSIINNKLELINYNQLLTN
jgi:hypothetical protein